MKKKIFKIEELKKKLSELKKKIALSHGVFDLIHPGHLIHFEQAKIKSDILVVSVTDDKYVNKGPGKPYFNISERLKSLAALEMIDYVVVSEEASSVKVIEALKPNFYVKGADYIDASKDITNKIKLESNVVKKNGGQIIFTTGKRFSSSKFINKNFILNNDQYKFIKNLKKKYGSDSILKFLDKIFKQVPLVIGESMIDDYTFCEAIGKSGKQVYLVLKKLNNERYLGGSLAIINNIAGITKKSNFISSLGNDSDANKFIFQKLKSNIKSFFIIKKNSPTIIKKRFIEHLDNTKLLGVYDMNDEFFNLKDEIKIINKISLFEKLSDLVIISDYGHNFFSEKIIKKLNNTKKFLAINAQVNAFTVGYNTITKYKKADLILMNQTELRQELRDRKADKFKLIKKLENKIKCKYIVVTHGYTGATIYETKGKKIYSVPAFAKKVIDKVGAGDALFPIVAMCLKAKIPPDVSLFFGSISAALNAEKHANKFNLDRPLLHKSIDHYLK